MSNMRYSILFVLIGSILLTVAARDPLLDSVFLRLYKRDGSFIDFDEKNASAVLTEIDTKERLVIFIHGALESIYAEDVALLRAAHLEHTSDNYIAVDYREIARLLYPAAAHLSLDVGKLLANILNEMVKNGLDPEKLQIIGHSLGAQVSGEIGRDVNFTVPRITALDPAGPLFYLIEPHLSTKDAKFVDVIHTDAGLFGSALKLGHVDFYPNFGHRPQPGCLAREISLSNFGLCSHQRSYMYYAESVKDKEAFLSVKCTSFEFFTGLCNQMNLVPMGYATPSDARGSFYLTTNSKSPYGRGLTGTKY